MQTQDTRAAVRDLYDAYERRDFDRVAALIHDDIDWMIYGPVQVFPFEGPRHGKVAVLEALGAIAKDYGLDRYVPQAVIVDGERAAVMSDVAFVQRTTGRTLSFRIADILRFQDGRVIEFREFTDSFDLAEQALGRFIEV
jgi:ketosteroid isomerase-like protein